MSHAPSKMDWLETNNSPLQLPPQFPPQRPFTSVFALSKNSEFFHVLITEFRVDLRWMKWLLTGNSIGSRNIQLKLSVFQIVPLGAGAQPTLTKWATGAGDELLGGSFPMATPNEKDVKRRKLTLGNCLTNIIALFRCAALSLSICIGAPCRQIAAQRTIAAAVFRQLILQSSGRALLRISSIRLSWSNRVARG